jgi:hypothetical protein
MEVAFDIALCLVRCGLNVFDLRSNTSEIFGSLFALSQSLQSIAPIAKCEFQPQLENLGNALKFALEKRSGSFANCSSSFFSPSTC